MPEYPAVVQADLQALQQSGTFVYSNGTFSNPTYDANGNLISWSENGIGFTATYDSQGRMATLTSLGTTRTFSYDSQSNLAGVA